MMLDFLICRPSTRGHRDLQNTHIDDYLAPRGPVTTHACMWADQTGKLEFLSRGKFTQTFKLCSLTLKECSMLLKNVWDNAVLF